jgi:hypothetical protein
MSGISDTSSVGQFVVAYQILYIKPRKIDVGYYLCGVFTLALRRMKKEVRKTGLGR